MVYRQRYRLEWLYFLGEASKSLVNILTSRYCIDVASDTTIRIQKLRFYEPHRNLPRHKAGNGCEDRFARLFARAYMTQFASLHPRATDDAVAVAREIPANGYGIADCVAVSWKRSNMQPAAGQIIEPSTFLSCARPTLRAFEVKLHDWRRALLQANRYRFFAHIPIVVLPADKCAVALKHIATFRLLGIGLWSFHPPESRIVAHYSPRRSRPLDRRQASRALGLVARASKALRAS
jgi:hypothetical protein